MSLALDVDSTVIVGKKARGSLGEGLGTRGPLATRESEDRGVTMIWRFSVSAKSQWFIEP